ncbi:hypothetical protein ACFSTD_18760 [Novosphingobium colocasiae]
MARREHQGGNRSMLNIIGAIVSGLVIGILARFFSTPARCR